MIAVGEGRVTDALPMLKENLPICRDLGNSFDLAVNLCRIAHTLAVAGGAQTAARLLSCSETLF